MLSGFNWSENRQAGQATQRLAWFRERLELGLSTRFFRLPRVQSRLRDIEDAIRQGNLQPDEAASQMLELLT